MPEVFAVSTVPSHTVGPAGEIDTEAFCAFTFVTNSNNNAPMQLKVNDLVIVFFCFRLLLEIVAKQIYGMQSWMKRKIQCFLPFVHKIGVNKGYTWVNFNVF
jgi:hypothetical protein